MVTELKFRVSHLGSGKGSIVNYTLLKKGYIKVNKLR